MIARFNIRDYVLKHTIDRVFDIGVKRGRGNKIYYDLGEFKVSANKYNTKILESIGFAEQECWIDIIQMIINIVVIYTLII